MPAEQDSQKEVPTRHEPRQEDSFDALARGLASGSVSRRKALRMLGAALVGGVLASFPGAAWAAKGGGGGKSFCAKYCRTLFGGDTAAQAECVSQGTKGTGPCFACGGPVNPAPTCGPTESVDPVSCTCVFSGNICSNYAGPCVSESGLDCRCFATVEGGLRCVENFGPAGCATHQTCNSSSQCPAGQRCIFTGCPDAQSKCMQGC
jgi:hypothetical protein